MARLDNVHVLALECHGSVGDGRSSAAWLAEKMRDAQHAQTALTCWLDDTEDAPATPSSARELERLTRERDHAGAAVAHALVSFWERTEIREDAQLPLGPAHPITGAVPA